MNHLIEECMISNVINSIEFQTEAGKVAALKFFENLPMHKSIVYRRANTILDMRNISPSSVNWKDIRSAEEKLKPYFVSNDLTEQTETQIFFTNEHLKVLNTIPYLISILLFLKIWITPILGIMMPIIFVLMPYLIIKFIMRIPMPWDFYWNVLKEMVLGIRGGEPIGLKQLSQVLYLITGFGQGMVQPVIAAQQAYASDMKIQEIGSNVIQYINASKKIYEHLMPTAVVKPPPLIDTTDPRMAYWWFRDNQILLESWIHQIGCVDVYWSLAMDARWLAVEWSDRLVLNNLADLCIKNPIGSDIAVGTHCILTGPNRGGKSSFLRAVLQQVLFARVFGISTCEAKVPWYSWIHSRIRSLDMPGVASLFEEDVRSCANILNKSSDQLGLVLIDELFHSTNPPDALFCATTFLNKFWLMENATSIISTHSFELLNKLPSHVQTLCCPATDEGNRLKYSYRIIPGICKLSSVREVLKEHGL
jgi:hypothetical protein